MLGNGLFLEREAAYRRMARVRRERQAAMTPEQRAAAAATKAKIRAATNRYRALQAKVKQPYSATAILTPDEEKLRQAVLARDWDAVFTLLPPRWWGPQTGTERSSPAKYSWREVTRTIYPPGYLSRAAASRRSRRRVELNGGFEPMSAQQLKNLPKGKFRVFKPWTEQELLNWTMSKWYTVAPGYVCSEAQRIAGVAYYWKYTQAWRRNPDTKPNHVFPFYPGGGAKKQSYGCIPYKKSLWDKIKKPLAIVVGVVAAVWLGPIVIGKIAGAGASSAAGGTAAAGAASGGSAAVTSGIVGAGAKAGAAAAITTKGAVAAAITTKATVSSAAALLTVKTAASTASIIATAAETGTLFTKVQNMTTWVNRARSVDAIIKGELPPPPIGISGGNFTEWAMDLAKKEVQDIIKEEAGQYISKRAQEKYEKEQEAIMRLEIEKMQRELAALISAQTPIAPAPEIDQPIREKIIEMQDIEKQRAQQNVMLLAGGAAVALFAIG